MHNNYAVIHIIIYLDDVFTAGPPGSDVCQNSMDAMAKVCAILNVPIKLEKTEGPATSLTFLRISLDSVAMKATITLEQKVELASAITALQAKHTCTKRQRLSLIGKLAFACKVLPPGCIFLRRLIDLSTTVGPLHHHITLNNEAKVDLHWWHIFLPDWPGSSLLLESHWSRVPDMELYTDASNRGYGAFWASRWFSEPWPHNHLGFPIRWKELYTIIVACSTWGEAWPHNYLGFPIVWKELYTILVACSTWGEAWPHNYLGFPIVWKELYTILVACSTWGEAWPHNHLGFPIVWKELYTILVACSTWGEAWSHNHLGFPIAWKELYTIIVACSTWVEAWPHNYLGFPIVWKELYTILVACSTWGEAWPHNYLGFPIVWKELYTILVACSTWGEAWPHNHLGFPIAWKELYTILVACSTWGEAWQRKQILFRCDNASVVASWQTGSCKCRPLMTLIRTLFFIAAKGNFYVSITHIAGIRNCIADHLSSLRTGIQAVSHSGRSPSHTSHHPCTADPGLTAKLNHLQLLGIAPSTRRTSQAGINCYQQFCTVYNLNPLPSFPLTLRYFCIHLSSSIQHSTIKLYLSALCLYYIENGYSYPTTDTLLQYVVKGIKHSQTNTPRPHLLITIHLLRDLKTALHNSSALTVHNKRMLWVTFCSAFYGFLRASELCAPAPHSFDPTATLRYRDFMTTHAAAHLLIKVSKTDPFRRTCTVTVGSTI